MRHRPVAVLVLALTLCGLGVPALACIVSQSDCCPAEAPAAPCGEQTPGDAVLAADAACCAVMPAPVTAAARDTARRLEVLVGDAGSTDPPPIAAWGPLGIESAPPRLPAALAAVPAPRADAALTWLRTGRLRL